MLEMYTNCLQQTTDMDPPQPESSHLHRFFFITGGQGWCETHALCHQQGVIKSWVLKKPLCLELLCKKNAFVSYIGRLKTKAITR